MDIQRTLLKLVRRRDSLIFHTVIKAICFKKSIKLKADINAKFYVYIARRMFRYFNNRLGFLCILLLACFIN